MTKVTQIKRGEAETLTEVGLLIASLCCLPGSFLIFPKSKIPGRWQPVLCLLFLPLAEPGELLSMPGAALSLDGMRGKGRSGGSQSTFPLRRPGSRDGSQEPGSSSTPRQLPPQPPSTEHSLINSEPVQQPSFIGRESKTQRGKEVCSRSHNKSEVGLVLELRPFPIQWGQQLDPCSPRPLQSNVPHI